MPTFDQNENKLETGFVSFIVTVTGGGEAFRYAGSDTPLTDADGHQYQPVPLMTDNITASGEMTGQDLVVKLPRSVPLADRFFPEASPTIYSIVIRQAHHDVGLIVDAPLVFSGVVTSVSSSGDNTEMRLKCSTQQGLLNRSGLRRRYQHQCPFVLYGPECRASKAASAFLADISVPATTTWADVELTVYGDDADNPNIWRGRDLGLMSNRIFLIGATITFGSKDYVVWDLGPINSQKNMIRVRLRTQDVQPLRGAINATQVDARVAKILPSCDHTVSCCQQVFANGQNFGGMPWIPFENPVKTMFVGGGA